MPYYSCTRRRSVAFAASPAGATTVARFCPVVSHSPVGNERRAVEAVIRLLAHAHEQRDIRARSVDAPQAAVPTQQQPARAVGDEAGPRIDGKLGVGDGDARRIKTADEGRNKPGLRSTAARAQEEEKRKDTHRAGFEGERAGDMGRLNCFHRHDG